MIAASPLYGQSFWNIPKRARPPIKIINGIAQVLRAEIRPQDVGEPKLTRRFQFSVEKTKTNMPR